MATWANALCLHGMEKSYSLIFITRETQIITQKSSYFLFYFLISRNLNLFALQYLHRHCGFVIAQSLDMRCQITLYI